MKNRTKEQQLARMMKMQGMLNKERSEFTESELTLFHELKEKHLRSHEENN